MNCHTMKAKIFIFFALVFCFSVFADEYSLNICDPGQCYALKNTLNSYVREIDSLYSNIYNRNTYAYGDFDNINRLSYSLPEGSVKRDIQSNATAGLSECNSISSALNSMNYLKESLNTFNNSIDCSACANGQCLDPVLLTNIYVCVSNSFVVTSSLLVSFSNLTQIVSSFYGSSTNYFDSSLYSLGVVTNSLSNIHSLLVDVDDYLYNFLDLYNYQLTSIEDVLNEINDMAFWVYSYTYRIMEVVEQYLSYLQTISENLSYLATNEYFDVNVVNLTNYFVAKSANVGVGTAPYQRMTYLGQVSEQSPLNPFNSPSAIRRANMAESLQGGFVNLLFSVSSLNNYFYWLMNYLGTNKTDYSDITTGLANLTNILNRVDGYVLGDFSNQFYKVFENIDILVSNSLNQVDYTTNLVSLLQTSTNHLASIDSKLDVLDYIKVLSDTPLSDFSGDSYYDYLTNLYLNGSSSSPSTNWFERIEILLASMVFGDSGASTISNEVEFINFSEESIENAFNDYTFQSELNSGIDLVENTGENFLTILRGFHDSLSSVTQPQSIAIGIGGLDGQDTTTYQDVMHGHFQVSFNSGASDNFTLIVRSMTTIIWILVTMMFVYFSARWLLSKVLFFYRLMRTLITSLFLK